ncbi:DUF192 domain-containing protein [Rhodoblastus acidophilus]|uniref:DUF192 domain-containing protein n=1 Tax=Candidatus Rhodoblastus alkanivorans TaxID=2954117 RepID=A0ABS9Z8A1_9HYPH|nr:DUF192 domain-containing protein [Candidatus Rhodoblastus alkanivorans]MCI4679478.1 DUF192 domain-containing protein [Candidatus Rhodoblastus alkanivorans]MCI4683923.1 DUF192 domain-containing protein [Candidatus Rhodoblastus alkanivorans]MDI4641242.1 DUF192 domain-containing protein [Rhodoblastus acidophilus]
MARLFGGSPRLVSLARALALILPFLAAASLSFGAPALALEAAATAALEPLAIVTDPNGSHPVEHHLMVEVMRTPAEREHGLMDRRYLPPDRGMLFKFNREQNVLMWMKNTYIPLDMIFISPNGEVTHVHENAEPLSEAIISSDGPALGVLEVNAGYARKIGLKEGDLVRHPMFAK